MKVFKFGGACIQNPTSIQQLAQIVKAAHSHPLVVVVSAMGKTTKGLEDVFRQKVAGQSYTAGLQRLYQFHLDIIDDCLVTLRQEAYQALVLWRRRLAATLALPVADATLDMLYSRIVAEGELLASRLVHYYLQEQLVACAWLDARSYVKTSDKRCDAQVVWAVTRRLIEKDFLPLLGRGQVVLTQGFIGSNEAGDTTTLGKEGSDFTGAIVAAALGAQSLTIWKDVPGVMSGDPKLFKKATKFEQLSYQAMAEMAFYGAKVVHPKTIQPLAAHDIPLYVRPFHCPHERGTVVTNGLAPVEQPVYILQEEQGLLLLSLEDLTFFDEERLQEVFYALLQQRLRANLLERSAYTLTVCLHDDPCKLQLLLAALSQRFKVSYHAPVNLLTVMHQDDDNPAQALLPPHTILLAQQKPGFYQAVLKPEVKVQ